MFFLCFQVMFLQNIKREWVLIEDLAASASQWRGIVVPLQGYFLECKEMRTYNLFLFKYLSPSYERGVCSVFLGGLLCNDCV